MMKIYYDIEDDIKAYPDAWCYIIIGGRNTGKTYGGLKYHLNNNIPHVFLKRTNRDVDLLCAGNTLGNKAPNYEIDLSPYKSINRDFDTHIKAFKIDDGLGAFYETDAEGAAVGAPKGYLLSLSAIHKYKGFDLSDCPSIIFDEFIPQPWERTQRTEGEQVMELYKTVSRDRFLRNKGELRLLCFANAVNVFNYTSEVLEVTDIIADMSAKKQEICYIDDRGIFIRILQTSEEMMKAEKKTGIYRAMNGTAWGRMAFGNEFAYNDFSNIKKVALKGYRCMYDLTYRGKSYYIYNNGTNYYMCKSRGNSSVHYDLDKEMGQRAFYYDHIPGLMAACIEGRMMFEKYSMYDMIVNYKKRFRV